ncbi:galactose-1-phosphate uridylyltransferase [Candidatus Woesearchaeota archaeon]|nr:MAG: galactose-1-phosphate uridylyltransferase [Candidatus Woesearchaeota archaeon]
MNELRKDYLIERFVIIAEGRGKRPEQFKQEKKGEEKVGKCFFCPGNEETTPQEIGRIPNGASWKMRWFPNKFPAVTNEGNPDVMTHNTFFTFASAFGQHEVIVETPEHEKKLWDLSEEDLFQLFKIYKERTEELSKRSGVKYVSVFKNHGSEAGTSIVHTHSQIVAYNIIPPLVEEEFAAYKKFGECPFCGIISAEKDSERRAYENEHAIAFCPYASRVPFEIWLMPKSHLPSITSLDDAQLKALAELLKKILAKLKGLNAPYNYYLHYHPENFHFHIEVTPRITKWAGFELGNNTYINIMPPEKAAEFYRQ